MKLKPKAFSCSGLRDDLTVLHGRRNFFTLAIQLNIGHCKH